MKYKMENIINSIESIFANKLRSSLSMLWIIIWVSSVIVLTAIWNGSQKQIVENVESFWTNLLTITPGTQTTVNTRTTSNILNLDLSNKLKQEILTIKTIAPQTNWNAQAIYQNNNLRANIVWTTTDYFETKNTKIVSWTNFWESHMDELQKVAIIWHTLYTDLFAWENPIWKSFKLWNNIYEIIWIMEEKWSNIDTSVIIPITTAQIRQLGNKNLTQIELSVIDSEKVNQTKDLVEWLILSVIWKSENDWSFTIRNQADMLDRIWAITGTMTMLLTGIAAISLLVWWIWVMNIMLVSVTERTREIGIRKAIWAWKKDILGQFLTESMVLSLFWWMIWITLSYIVVFVLNNYLLIVSIISINSIFLSFGVAVFIGIFFGLLPAYKAAKLRPIDALRFE
jgi:putative ABC transport system permease protein